MPVLVRHARAAFLVTVLTLPLVRSAHAGTADVVDPRFSYCGSVVLGCSSGGPMPQPAGPFAPASDGYVVGLRDVSNAPKLGATAILDFSQTDLRLYVDQESGTTVDCARDWLTRIVGHGAETVFHPRFGGFTNQGNVIIAGSGVVIAEVAARSTDMNAQGGTTDLGDLSTFSAFYLAHATNHPEADFNASGGPIDLNDLTLMVREYQLGAESSYCP